MRKKQLANKHNYYNNFNYYFCTDLFTMMRKKSEVWYHFSSSEPVKGKCQYRSFVISCTGGSTGNLTRHLKRKHPTIPLHWTPTPAEMSDSRYPQDEGPQQNPAAKEVAAAVVHEDISSACTSRSIHAR
jgi:hypothetical protein